MRRVTDCFRTGLLAAAATLLAATSVQAGRSSSLMDISADGRLLACSNRDSGTVTIIDLRTHAVVHEVPVGHHPEGVTFLGDTHRAAVAVYGDDVVKLLDADAGAVAGEIAVFDEPYGIVSTPDGRRLYLTLDYPGQVVEIDLQTSQATREIAVGSFPRGLALSADGRRLFVTEYYTGVVKELETESGALTGSVWTGSAQDNLARQLVLHPTRPKAYLPHIRSVVTNPQGEWAISPYVSVLDIDDRDQHRRKRVQIDAFRGT